MDLPPIKCLALFLSTVLPYLSPETVLLADTLVWSSEQLSWSKLRLVLVAKFGFGVLRVAAKGFRAGWLCVSYVVLLAVLHVLLKGRYIYLYIL